MTLFSHERPSKSQPTDRRLSLAHALDRARRATDALFNLLTSDGLLERPIAERHRLIFYLGHLEAFDFNLLCKTIQKRPPLSDRFETLFAFGIDPVDGRLPNDQPSDWPSVDEISTWTRAAREAVDDVVRTASFDGWLQQGWAIQMATEHRLMHAETLCYLFQRLPHQFKIRPANPQWQPDPLQVARDQTSIRISAGAAVLGLDRSVTPFGGWDNEYNQHIVDVPAFSIDALPVSNRHWIQFIETGGYQTKTLWDAAAWKWRESAQLNHPAFWRRERNRWMWIGMFEDFELPLDWPVYVSHAEATAYARWTNAELPSEAQWHRAAFGDRNVTEQTGNFGGLRFDPIASGGFPDGDSCWGVSDLVGNGWEWTRTPFAPFEGFEPLPFYQGYSANFFDGKHFVLKGASARTDVAFIRRSFRNWFQPHYQHVFAKFRLVNRAEGRHA